MAKFKVLLELEVEGDNQLDAVQGFINSFIEDSNQLIYIVQNSETKEIFSVDLDEDENEAVLPYNDYQVFSFN